MKNFLATTFLVLSFNLSIVHPKLYIETEIGLEIHQKLLFDDGVLFMNLVKPINESCAEPRFNFRILHPNGTLDAFEVDPLIPEYNFCRGPPFGEYLFFIQRSLPDSLYIIYVDSTDDINTASHNVLLISRMGKPISNTYIAPAPILNGSIYAGSINPQISEEYGFLFSKYETEFIMTWICFDKPNDKGELNQLNSGKVYLKNPFDPYRIISSGINGNYAFFTFVISNSTKTRPPVFEASLGFINPKTNEMKGPYIVYLSSVPNLDAEYDIIIMNCNLYHYANTMNTCVFMFFNKKSLDITIIEIIFKDSGVVTDNRITTIPYNTMADAISLDINMMELFNGGHLIYTCIATKNNNYQILNVTIFDNDRNYHSTLNFPSRLRASKDCTVLTAGRSGIAFLIAQDGGEKLSYRILSTNLPKFVIDGGYGSTNIKFTYPSINSTIPLSTTTNISITYNFSIEMSTNNISIYQHDDGNPPILRQYISKTSSSFFSYSSNNTTIDIEVLSSTFNRPNSNYFIVIDDDAVKEISSNQALLGVKANRWNFNTTNKNDEYIFAGEMTGRFSLTVEGAEYFRSLSSSDQKTFLSLLKFQLSEAIPININRLNDIVCCQYVGTQIFLRLLIKSTDNPDEQSVKSIMGDLDILIQKKEITPISYYNITNLIDEKFGFKQYENVFDEFKFHLIGAAIGLTGLSLIYRYAKKRYPEGDNLIIFKFSLIILDLVLDVSFIVNDVKHAPALIIPSIIFCVLPIAANVVTSAIIVLKEVAENQLFKLWFKRNINVAIVFTLLAGLDLKVLDVLSSQFAGMMMFSANFSKKAQPWIFWGGFIGLIIEDIPQFVIQIIYRRRIVMYNAIPFLTLGVSAVSLSVSISLKIYKTLAYFKLIPSVAHCVKRKLKKESGNRRNTVV